MHPLSEIIHQFVEPLADVKRVVVAFSGGIDSTVLLHAVLGANLSQPVSAIHVNHQLSNNAPKWQLHCEQVFENMKVPGRCFKVDVSANGGGIEQAARVARLQVLQDQLIEGDLLLMGHHQDDQVETFFLRLFRGAGLRGLGGVPKLRSFGLASLGRPLLSVSKVEIEAYAHDKQLQWVEDDSNTSNKFDRNYLRLEVLPILHTRWPSFSARVSKTVSLLKDEQSLLTEYLGYDLETLCPRAERVGYSVDLSILQLWDSPRQNAVIRHWLDQLGCRMPTQARMSELSKLLIAGIDKTPVLSLGDCELRRFRGRLYWLPMHWAVGNLCFETAACGLKVGPDYQVRSRSEWSTIRRCHPQGREHSQTFKKLLQEYELEPWLRAQVPLVMSGDRLAAVGDLWVESDFYSSSAPAQTVLWRAS